MVPPSVPSRHVAFQMVPRPHFGPRSQTTGRANESRPMASRQAVGCVYGLLGPTEKGTCHVLVGSGVGPQRTRFFLCLLALDGPVSSLICFVFRAAPYTSRTDLGRCGAHTKPPKTGSAAGFVASECRLPLVKLPLVCRLVT